MNGAETMEMPFVAALPKREKSRVVKLLEHVAEMSKLVESKGMLIPVRLASSIVGVTHQRISALMEAGVLERVDYNGHPFVTEKSLIAWARTERKAGRPVKIVNTWSESQRVARDYVGAK